MGGVKTYIKTFPHAFLDIFTPLINLLPHKRGGEEVEILKDFRGLVKPGEMCLVLGRPGSGCTTFLKVMANQRFGYTGVDGEVLYGRFGAETFGKRYRGEAVYNQEGKFPSLLSFFFFFFSFFYCCYWWGGTSAAFYPVEMMDAKSKTEFPVCGK